MELTFILLYMLSNFYNDQLPQRNFRDSQCEQQQKQIYVIVAPVWSQGEILRNILNNGDAKKKQRKWKHKRKRS